MIFRDRVGGGGKEKSSAIPLCRCTTDGGRRDLEGSVSAESGEVGDTGRKEDSEEDFVVEALKERAVSVPAIAGGGREKAVSSKKRWQ